MQKTFLLLLFLTFNLAVWAEDFTLKIYSEKPKQSFKNIAAMEISFGYKPIGSLMVDPEFYIQADNYFPELMFQTVSDDHTKLRVFFDDELDASELIFAGKFNRNNFTGKAKAQVLDMRFMSKFGESFDDSQVKTELVLGNTDEVLPYKGISKAELLGPSERVFTKEMFLAIGDIETYGFEIDSKRNKFFINKKPAKLINKEIITANIFIEKFQEKLPIVFEVLVEGEMVSKKIGLIHLVEPI